MTSPWPVCIHDEDAAVCPVCWAGLNRQLRRDRWNPWRRLRWWWLDLRARRRRRPGDPF